MRQGSNGRRPRGRSHRRQQHGGGSPRGNNFDSNGPEGRIRGNAHQVYEKYVGMARDSLASGDRVAAETYYQHAEHYYRIVNASTDPQPNGGQGGRPPRQSGNGRMDGEAVDGEAQAVPQDGAGGEQPRAAEGQTGRQNRRESKPEPKPVVEAEAAPEVEAEPVDEAEPAAQPKEPSPDEATGA
jgi:hypothetical protein